MAREDSRTRPVCVEKIQGLMDQQNVSKKELARRTRVSVKQIHNILQRRNDPREDTVVRIAAALGVRWRTLLVEHDAEPEQLESEGGVAIQTTVDLIVETRHDLSTEEFKRRIVNAIRGVGDERLKGADVIRIVKLRPEDEV